MFLKPVMTVSLIFLFQLPVSFDRGSVPCYAFKIYKLSQPVVTPQPLGLHLNCCALNFLLAYGGTESLPSLLFVSVWFAVAYLLSTWSCLPFMGTILSNSPGKHLHAIVLCLPESSVPTIYLFTVE